MLPGFSDYCDAQESSLAAQFDLHQMCGRAALVETTPFQLVEMMCQPFAHPRTKAYRVTHTDKEIPTTVPTQVPHDWARLIRKLRWIGLEEKAKRLEMALSTLPAGQRTAQAGQGHRRS
jgi:hypothetical protein